MAYNKRYRVSHTFENGSRFIGTIGIRNATPDFPENIEGRMIVESVNGRFQGIFKLVNGTVGRVSGVVLPPQPKNWIFEPQGADKYLQNETGPNVELPRTELDIASNREPQYDSVLSDGPEREKNGPDTIRIHVQRRHHRRRKRKIPAARIGLHQHQLE